MEKPSIELLERAADQLNRSGKGRKAMQDLLAFLDEGAVSLDTNNQAAVFILLNGTWGEFTGTARDIMRDRITRPAPRA